MPHSRNAFHTCGAAQQRSYLAPWPQPRRIRNSAHTLFSSTLNASPPITTPHVHNTFRHVTCPLRQLYPVPQRKGELIACTKTTEQNAKHIPAVIISSWALGVSAQATALTGVSTRVTALTGVSARVTALAGVCEFLLLNVHGGEKVYYGRVRQACLHELLH